MSSTHALEHTQKDNAPRYYNTVSDRMTCKYLLMKRFKPETYELKTVLTSISVQLDVKCMTLMYVCLLDSVSCVDTPMVYHRYQQMIENGTCIWGFEHGVICWGIHVVKFPCVHAVNSSEIPNNHLGCIKPCKQ